MNQSPKGSCYIFKNSRAISLHFCHVLGAKIRILEVYILIITGMNDDVSTKLILQLQ